MFLVHAFLDDVFADVSTPAELYSKRNPYKQSDLPIRFKSDKKSIPIMRALKNRSKALSPTRAWSVDSATKDAQRVCRELGILERFTYYRIHRGTGNRFEGESTHKRFGVLTL